MNVSNVNHTAKTPYQQKTVQAVIRSEQDLQTVRQAAEKCGMSVSGFARFYVVKAAQQIVSGEMVHAAQSAESQATGA